MNAIAITCAVALGVLCWTWLVYPAMIWALAQLKPVRAPRVAVGDLPSVTAILATRDDPQTIAARVRDFLAADYPAERLDVVVGVDGDSARLAAVVAACPADRVTIVSADAGGGKVAGLNAAVRAARGSVLVFSDSQQRFAADAIQRMVSHLVADPTLGAVGGALQLPGDRAEAGGRSPVEWYWAMERQLRAAEARVHSCVGVSGSIYAMWRTDWEPMPAQLILDDVWLPMRLVMRGRRVGYDLLAKAWDARSTTSSAEKVRKVRTLTGNFQLVAWLPGVLVPLRNPIFLQFLSHKLLRLLTPWLLMVAAAAGAALAIAQIGRDAMLMLLAVIGGAAVVVLLWRPMRAKATRVLSWGWSMQVALVEATFNGMRGRWDVWR